MKINIKVMTVEAYKTLQTDSIGIQRMVKDHPSDSSWLKGYLGFEPYETKTDEIENFELDDISNDDEIIIKNNILIFEKLKNLPRYILCDIRFWAWINFEKAYKQAIAINSTKESTFGNLWFPNNSRRGLMLGIISRGFFKVEISVDNNSDDKYYLTKFLHTSVDEVYRSFVFRNYGMNKNITKGALKAQYDFWKNNNIRLSQELVRTLMTQVSKMGSVMLLDYMTTNEVEYRVKTMIQEII